MHARPRTLVGGVLAAMVGSLLMLGAGSPAQASTTIDLQGTVKGGPNGIALAGVHVYVDPTILHNDVYDTVTDSHGHYAFRGMQTGDYTIYFDKQRKTDDDPGWISEWYADAHVESAAKVVHVVRNHPGTSRNAYLAKGQFVSGTVTAPSGVSPQIVHGTAYNLANNEASAIDNVAPDGSWKVILAPGKYKLRFASEKGTAADSWDQATHTATQYYGWYGGVDREHAATVAVTVDAPVTGIEAELPQTLSSSVLPSIQGAPIAGHTLVANPGALSLLVGESVDYSWLRWATDSDQYTYVGKFGTYVPTLADRGHQLTVTAFVGGTATISAISARTAVVRSASATGIRGGSSHRHRAWVVARAFVPGVSSPIGTFTLMRGGTVVKRDVALVHGRATMFLRGQPSGKRVYRAIYSGNPRIIGSQSRWLTIRVR